MEGLNVSGQNINNIRNANDIVLTANGNRACGQWKKILRINLTKTYYK